MHETLTILFCPWDAVGCVNPSIGIAQVLRDRGHRIVFAIGDGWKAKLTIYGFEEVIIEQKHSTDETIEDPAKVWADMCEKNGLFSSLTPLQKMKNTNENLLKDIIEMSKVSDPLIKDIVDRIKPDVIIVDSYVWMPSIMCSGIPWVWSLYSNPLSRDYVLDDENIPPSLLGLPIDSQRELWDKMREEKNKSLRDAWTNYNQWLMSKGYPSLLNYKMTTPSPYLNIYMYPEEIDYTYTEQLRSNWYRFDCFMRSGNEHNFEIPQKLRNRSGKLIYLSMGSMGGIDVKLMKRLVSILSKSEHRFIVSKGPLHEQYELAENMWGEGVVPQIKILPIVDLVITHGGNNTFTETLYFGKPMIIMPLFIDQFDNAQRIQDKGLGVRLDLYECTESELLGSIDKLLNDKNVASKLEKISKRIQTSKSILKVAQLIEGLVK